MGYHLHKMVLSSPTNTEVRIKMWSSRLGPGVTSLLISVHTHVLLIKLAPEASTPVASLAPGKSPPQRVCDGKIVHQPKGLCGAPFNREQGAFGEMQLGNTKSWDFTPRGWFHQKHRQYQVLAKTRKTLLRCSGDAKRGGHRGG